jgi:PTH1 family peptidyl-tRNA hydrolase
VLKEATREDQKLIDDAIEASLAVLPMAVKGDYQKAMSQLHTLKPDA